MSNRPLTIQQDCTVILRHWWAEHGAKVICIALVPMALWACLRLNQEFHRLVWRQDQVGAIDLKLRHQEVQQWFAGRPVYEELELAMYPPASHVILWPLVGWLIVEQARWLWAASGVVMLGWLASLIVRGGGAETFLERTFSVLLLLSMHATSIAVGNGQLILHLLPMLITSVILLRHEGAWHLDILAAMLMVAALVSPAITAPFFWLVLFVPDGKRPALLVVLGYGLLTLLAASFQAASVLSLSTQWLEMSQDGAAREAVKGGYANLHSWLAACELQEWNRTASLFALGALGVWVYRHRQVDRWILLGISAIVARTWTYHRVYDDVLMLLPTIALFRLAKRGTSANGADLIAGVLCAASVMTGFLPASRFLAFPAPWPWLFQIGQGFVWLVMGIFLVQQASRERSVRVADSATRRNCEVSLTGARHYDGTDSPFDL